MRSREKIDETFSDIYYYNCSIVLAITTTTCNNMVVDGKQNKF